VASRNPIDRVFGAIVPRAVDAIDPGEIIEKVDVDHVLDRIDVNALIDRIDVDRLLERIDVEALIQRIDVQALIDRVDVEALINRVDVGGIVDRVDVDGLVQRVDVEGIVQRVDLDLLMKDVDVDVLIQRVDVQGLIDRVDLNAVLAEVDVAPLVAKAGIDQIVADAATGVATRTLDLIRRAIYRADRVLLRVLDRLPRRGPPPVAAVTPAGPLARTLAFLLDSTVISLLFTAGVYLGSTLLELFTAETVDPTRGSGPIWAIVFAGWSYLYYWASIAATGRTVGKGLLGLAVLAREGGRLGVGPAAVRAFVFPFSFILGLGFIPTLLRRDRRALHDLAAGSIVAIAPI
jgi:uncharacterized RDD family membrane protein YckC